MDKIKRYDKQANHLLNLVQAAHILGYKDYRIIESMIDQGLLQAHTIGQRLHQCQERTWMLDQALYLAWRIQYF